jgi:hypothetical protein
MVYPFWGGILVGVVAGETPATEEKDAIFRLKHLVFRLLA